MSKVFSFRFDDETAEKLRELCDAYKMSPVGFISLKILQEHEAMKGNPKLTEIMGLFEKMTELSQEMERVLKWAPPRP